MTSKQPIFVYIQQFGAFFKLTLAEWKAILDEGKRTGGHMVPEHAELERRPSFLIPSNIDSGRNHCVNHHASHLYYEPLDWRENDYADAEEELKQKGLWT